MRIAGVPLWSLVLVACILAPIVVRLWMESEQRRAKVRTARILQGLRRRKAAIDEASGAGRASEAASASSDTPGHGA